jgi:uncharacterized protein
MRTPKILLILILIFFSCKTAEVETKIENPKAETNLLKFPKRIGFVNDFENIFSEEEIKFLEKLLVYYEKSSNKEIAVITIGSIPENTEFDDYAIRMSNNWTVGKRNNGNGLTVVLSKSVKKVRISTSDKTKELYLSDELCEKVIYETMIPEFKNGKHYDGVLLGLNELIRKWI